MKIWFGGCAVLLAVATQVLSQRAPAAVSKDFIEELVLANHILANEEVVDGYGHVSVRSPSNPNHYFLARAGAPALVTAAAITEYDLESKPVTDTSVTGYTERFIHGEIYKARPDVMAVVHCHCPEVIPFANTSVPLQPMPTLPAANAASKHSAPRPSFRSIAIHPCRIAIFSQLGRTAAQPLQNSAVAEQLPPANAAGKLYGNLGRPPRGR